MKSKHDDRLGEMYLYGGAYYTLLNSFTMGYPKNYYYFVKRLTPYTTNHCELDKCPMHKQCHNNEHCGCIHINRIHNAVKVPKIKAELLK